MKKKLVKIASINMNKKTYLYVTSIDFVDLNIKVRKWTLSNYRPKTVL